MNANKITVRTLVNAERKRVWDYYTHPKHITQWNFADPSWHCPKAENNLKPGGKYLARMEARDGSFGFDFEATYTKIKVGEQLSYEFGGRTATVLFQEDDAKTEVVVTFEPEKENPLEMQKNGWQAILNNFKKYTESDS